uniref:Odorant receptor n=1 Tax=Phlebotomus papatasi TaxID=29031 RepID=A0A3F2ZEN9_PHLPP
MLKYIACYSDYQKFEEFLQFLLRILNFSFIPKNLLKGYQKLIFPIFELYALTSAVFTIMYYEKDLIILIVKIMQIMGLLQLLTKSLSVLVNTEQLNILFQFIQEAYKIHQVHYVTESAKIHLKRSLSIIKIITGILFTAAFGAGGGVIFYFIYIDSMLLAVPGVFLTPSSNLFYQHIHQFFVLQLSAILLMIPDTVLISIGFYFIAILNIFKDILRYIDNVDSTNKRQFLLQIHKLHCNILDKFCIFSEVFYYTFTVQIATSVVFMMFIFFILQTEGGLAFLPLLLAIFGQFGAACIFGELIYSKTEKLSTELYLTNWYELDLEEQKILLMMLYMTQKTFGLKAAGMYDINIEMFIEVIKAGISCLAILYTLA